ncbi:hypothetical protein Tco_0653618 [Tanacetum coccineum]|uniref:Uncharacterized protein n=1 Tax=Tanacetum coccineum TaxID=301880 RepID=A0ABQ4X0Y1_9ASTR
MDDSILSNNNTTTDSFFKPYLITRGKCDTEKEDEQSQTKRNASESIDEQPNKRMCKAEKFEAIQYSLGPNEEYIAIRRLIMEYLVNISKRSAFWSLNEDILKIIILKTIRIPTRRYYVPGACTHQRLPRKQVQYAVSSEA